MKSKSFGSTALFKDVIGAMHAAKMASLPEI
jgi:hypothetical protein